jgi:hypothetical protein
MVTVVEKLEAALERARQEAAEAAAAAADAPGTSAAAAAGTSAAAAAAAADEEEEEEQQQAAGEEEEDQQEEEEAAPAAKGKKPGSLAAAAASPAQKVRPLRCGAACSPARPPSVRRHRVPSTLCPPPGGRAHLRCSASPPNNHPPPPALAPCQAPAPAEPWAREVAELALEFPEFDVGLVRAMLEDQVGRTRGPGAASLGARRAREQGGGAVARGPGAWH